MARQRVRKRPISEINVVPYIDVMLVLLVIFMVTAPLLTQGVKIDLPEAAANIMDADQQEPLIVSVDSMGNLYLNIGGNPDRAIEEDALVQRVSAVLRRRQDKTVLVRGDHAADYGSIVAAMVMLQQAGVPHIGLVTEPPDTAR